MRSFLLLLLLICVSSNAAAQHYLSVGIEKRKEGEEYNSPNLHDTLFSTSIHDRYINDFYSIGLVYKKNALILDVSLSFVYNKFEHAGRKGQTISGNGYTESKYHHARMDIRYTYLGTKLGISRAIFYRKKFNLLLGGSMQFEILTSQKEANHYDSIVESYSNSWYNIFTGDYQTSSTLSYEISREAFDGLRLSNLFFSGGIHISPRFEFKNFLIITNLEMGWNFKPRTYSNIRDNYNEDQYSNGKIRIFTQVGLSLAYQIPIEINDK